MGETQVFAKSYGVLGGLENWDGDVGHSLQTDVSIEGWVISNTSDWLDG